MNEDYTQPFRVPPRMAKRLGWICHDGYLPALEKERFPIESAPQEYQFDLGRMEYLQNQLNEIKKTSHSHSYKKRTKYIVEG